MKCFRKRSKLMGSAFELGLVEQDEVKARYLLELGIAEIKRIENLLSEFLPDSVTSLINKQSGRQKIKIDKEVFDLIHRSQKISGLTQGFFDITVGPLKKLYQFKNQAFQLPEKKLIQKTLEKTGFRKIELDHSDDSLFLKEKDMHISFAAIGKGYAADAVKRLWLENKVQAGFINASGDLTAFGHDANGEAWKIGIANPDLKEKVLFHVPLHNASVATSGDYEQHFWYEGKRYSHNINPKTGLPLHGIKSVSVFSPSAELSDALATAIYAMGVDLGLGFINQLPNTHAILIDEQNKVSFSKAIAYEAVS